MEKKFIDIEELFRSKNAKILKFIPGFVLRYLKRVIHQDEINDFMARNKDKTGTDFCDQIIKEFKINIIVKGAENIPLSGGCIFAANHPLGGLDGMAMASVIARSRKDVFFIVNDLLLNLTNLRNIFVGVNKHGRNAIPSLINVDDLFASEHAVCMFPAGMVSRRKKGLIRDLVWKKTVITRAKIHNKPVIPVHFDGRLSNFFYRLSNFRTAIGLKANIEMLYLADEMYSQVGNTVTITFGKPINPDFFNASKTDVQWAEWLKEKVYKLQAERSE